MANILTEWGITPEEYSEIVAENPSLRGYTFGYVAEYKLRKTWFARDRRITELRKYDDHDRSKKGDLAFVFNNIAEVTIESKALYTDRIEQLGPDEWRGFVGCDASDRRLVTFPNGSTIETTCLLVGKFDLLAVCLYQFGKKWRWAFAKNGDLPRSTYRRYTEYQREHLLATRIELSWPLRQPFHDEPFLLLDELVAARRRE